MKKRLLSIFLCLAMLSAVIMGCSTGKEKNASEIKEKNVAEAEEEDTLEGTHVFMFKSVGNSFGNLMYEGFAEYLTTKGEKVAYWSPEETTVDAQVKIMEELIAQNVASITISTNGSTGYEEVLKKAKEAGIPIVSVDSEINPEYRVCHISQADSKDVGAYLVQAAVLIALGIDYPEEKSNMKEVVTDALKDYTDQEIFLGVLSAWNDTPVQKQWIEDMKVELSDSCYAGKVSNELDIKYGNDDFVESILQTNLFVEESKVDCIIAPTTIGIQAAGQVLMNCNSEIKLTGLGLPSEMQLFMPGSASEDAFAHVCPYMMLWDVMHLGATAGAVIYASVYEGFTGEAGATFTMDAFGEYEKTSYTVTERGEGTIITAGVPYIFYKGNMEEWIDVL